MVARLNDAVTGTTSTQGVGRATGRDRAGATGDGAQCALTSPDGLFEQLTKTVLETALQEETTEHLGYGKRAHRHGLRNHP